ncbi:MBL fold metallo-hydrolase [Haloarculaceae archaeon H-GB2-1]|nr:MBL fold metallo-hydrolase [Haloarculaceae archaeon H-GB11]MEA5409377.1 MBL fold metallo-hydrolase [Haloarculaceae archaeon H-GB2-1]
MELTILGSGQPLPEVDRGGAAITADLGGDRVLVDCGPKAVHRLLEQGVDITAIEDVFFTHHHVDHNASFLYFAVISWYVGRTDLTVYGPRGTESLVDGIESIYDQTVESWTQWSNLVGETTPKAGIDDVETVHVDPDFEHDADGWSVSALAVSHDTEIFDPRAYRFEEHETGRSFVFSGDTAAIPEMADFAAGADVLVHEANALGPDETLLPKTEIPDQYLEPPFEKYYESYFDDDSAEESSATTPPPRRRPTSRPMRASTRSF